MRQLFLSVASIAALLAGPAAGQVAPQDQDNANKSMLGPRMPDALPAPTPIVPDAGGQPAVPQVVAPTPIAPAPPDLGTVTAVPLPPPGTVPSQPAPAVVTPLPPAPALATPLPPAPAVATRPNAVPGTGPVGTPVPLTPIPLTLPPQAAPPLAAARPTGPVVNTPNGPVASTKLPTPALSPEASPADFLRAARGALAAGRNGEARSALEMAQTRLLDRVVDAGKEQIPSNNLAVKQISDAINALLSNDRMTCLRYIEFASQTIGSPLN